MVNVGYFLSCEEFGLRELVRQAKLAADAGFDDVYVAQIGPRQDGFFDFWRTNVRA